MPIKSVQAGCERFAVKSTIQLAYMTRLRGIKRPQRESDHSPQSSVMFKEAWSYNSVPPYKENFTFYLYKVRQWKGY